MDQIQVLSAAVIVLGVGSAMRWLRLLIESRALRRRVEVLENDVKVLYRSLNSHEHLEDQPARNMWSEP